MICSATTVHSACPDLALFPGHAVGGGGGGGGGWPGDNASPDQHGIEHD